MNAKVNDETPIAMLNVGQLRVALGINETPSETSQPEKEQKQYVYGLAGIRQLFNVSHATAQRYKDTIINKAVMQQGRKIIVDKEEAVKLFKEYTTR